MKTIVSSLVVAAALSGMVSCTYHEVTPAPTVTTQSTTEVTRTTSPYTGASTTTTRETKVLQ